MTACAGPILADYTEDVPGAAPSEDGEGWVCPVEFRPPPVAAVDDERTAAFLSEIGDLQPWYNLGNERRGTTFGASGLDPASCARFVVDFLGDRATTDAWPDLRPGDVLKIVLMDVKAFYLEAATARPGRATSTELEDWFRGETAGGRIFLDLQRQCAASDDEFIALLGVQYIVPRTQFHRIG